ncbi:phosphodiester glycosidase family protein [Paenibacillus solisilvae]|uniref:Phosphodiester glycosidase family protein n=1 Tax=Paenibacillus solisilvae TaxID=2486751 RepID=A0ABW0VUE3_9BACL
MKNAKTTTGKRTLALIAMGTLLLSVYGGVQGVLVPQATTAYAAVSSEDGTVQFTGTEQVAPGVTYRSFRVITSHGSAAGHLVDADLNNPKVELDLLHPDVVAQREPVSQMADEQHAVAGVNGDFFNISETHEGVAPTNSSVGPEIADGESLKAAVPNGQRFGPGLPAGTSTQDVFGLGVDGRARVSSLTLKGQVRTKNGLFDLDGLNQYALPVNGVGVYTHDWGATSRVRPTCGTDTNRNALCSTDTLEITVQNGIVTSINSQPGAGVIPDDTIVLVGREGGVDELSGFKLGDRVKVDYRLVTKDAPRFEFAVGGFPILRDGQPLNSLDDTTLAPRTSAGVSEDGRHVYLAVLDGRAAASVGMSVSELAQLMWSFGAHDAVNLDGGGSSTLAALQPGEQKVTVKNTPSDGSERSVANGIGVFVRH